MRKTLVAAFTATLVFAGAAFAASFEVNDTVLASGTGDVTSCTDNVTVSWRTNPYDASVDDYTLNRISLSTAGDGCAMLPFTATLLDEDGDTMYVRKANLGVGGNTHIDSVNFTRNANLAIPVGEIGGLSVQINGQNVATSW